jgi:cation transport regulator ChaC
MERKLVFGFGSLIGEESLRVTAPNAADIRPAYIQGFVREFNLWDADGFTERNLDLAGIPFCALDVRPISDQSARVNGVTFTVGEQDFKRLLVREEEYNVIETDAYDYETNESIGNCIVFSAGKNNGSFDFTSPAGMRYLQGYLHDARQYGDKYYQELLATTFIDGKDLYHYQQYIEQPTDLMQ